MLPICYDLRKSFWGSSASLFRLEFSLETPSSVFFLILPIISSCIPDIFSNYLQESLLHFLNSFHYSIKDFFRNAFEEIFQELFISSRYCLSTSCCGFSKGTTSRSWKIFCRIFSKRLFKGIPTGFQSEIILRIFSDSSGDYFKDSFIHTSYF